MDQKSMWRQALAEMRTVHYGQDTARRCGGWRSSPYPAEETHMKNAVYILGTHCRLHQKIGVEQCSLWGLLLISTHHEDSEHWSRRNKMKVEVKKEKKKEEKKASVCFLSLSFTSWMFLQRNTNLFCLGFVNRDIAPFFKSYGNIKSKECSSC